MSDRVAVIGSNSFSGAHLVAHLLGKDYDVLGVSRSQEVSSPFNPYADQLGSVQWTFVQADLGDTASVMTALQDFQPRYVINFAAQSMVAESWVSPADWYRTNVVALSELVGGLSKLESMERFVQVSTPEVYGSTEGWISEGWQFNPTTPYAISRAAGDMHLKAMHDVHGFPVCFTRAANVYGPGQQLYRIVPRAMLYARTQQTLILDGGGRSVRSFISIADVSDATERVMRGGTSGDCYHVSTTRIISIRELVERIAAMAEVEIESFVHWGPERPGKDHAYMLDSSHIQDELGWRPRISLESGLEQTLAWVDSHLPELMNSPSTYVHRR